MRLVEYVDGKRATPFNSISELYPNASLIISYTALFCTEHWANALEVKQEGANVPQHQRKYINIVGKIFN